MAKNADEKKPIYKKVWFWIVIVVLVIGIFGGGDSDLNSNNETNNNNTATTVEENVEDKNVEDKNVETNTVENNSVIELIAGEQGEYGKLVTMSEGTEFEESFYAYYVPAGTYTVENKGDYMTQVSVYEGFAQNKETGYDEYTNNGDIKLIDTGKTETITVPDGWFIEIQEPSHITLTITK